MIILKVKYKSYWLLFFSILMYFWRCISVSILSLDGPIKPLGFCEEATALNSRILKLPNCCSACRTCFFSSCYNWKQHDFTTALTLNPRFKHALGEEYHYASEAIIYIVFLKSLHSPTNEEFPPYCLIVYLN